MSKKSLLYIIIIICVLTSGFFLASNYRSSIEMKNRGENIIPSVKDVEDIIMHFENSEYISKAFISNLDASTGVVTITLDSTNELYNETLKTVMGENVLTKAGLLKIFSSYQDGREEIDSIKSALKMARNTGYGIVYPGIKDMKLETPEIVKQGSRYGVKLKAVASSIHLMKVDVESTFEPIIGSELQSKELIKGLNKC